MRVSQRRVGTREDGGPTRGRKRTEDSHDTCVCVCTCTYTCDGRTKGVTRVWGVGLCLGKKVINTDLDTVGRGEKRNPIVQYPVV